MKPGIIVILGDSALQPPWLASLVAAAGFECKCVANLDDLRDLAESRIAAVFFNAKHLELPWKDAIVWIRSIAPEARCVVCHGFHEDVEWQSLLNWGAFHSLNLPLDATEVRQAIGFIAMDANKLETISPDLPKSASELG